MKTFGKIVSALIFVFLLLVLVTKFGSDPERNKRRDESIHFASLIKRMSKDPASFQVVELRRSHIDSTCLTYRATNSFGGYIQGHAVKTPDGKVQIDGVEGTEKYLWEAYCGDGSGYTITVFDSSL